MLGAQHGRDRFRRDLVALTRAADVTLKERRRLVLMVRETPLHLGHLRTMAALSEMGAVIAPPMAAFYAKPRDLAEMVDQTVGRVLDLFGLIVGAHSALERPRRSVVTLWDWAKLTWDRPGVGAACVSLQDEHRQCVPLLLWALWGRSKTAGSTARSPSMRWRCADRWKRR